jgi:hypothetical protein
MFAKGIRAIESPFALAGPIRALIPLSGAKTAFYNCRAAWHPDATALVND